MSSHKRRALPLSKPIKRVEATAGSAGRGARCEVQAHLRTALDPQPAVLKYVIANVPHAIFWKDRECRFLGGNQHFLNDTGMMALENLVGKTDYDVWGRPEEADSFVKVDRQVMESGNPILDIEESLLRSDGKQRVLLTSKVPIRDESGRVHGLLGIYADITERKQMEIELQKAKEAADAAARAKGEFLTVMSHELRTPLSLILGPLASLLASEELPAKTRSDLTRVQRNARRLHRLVDDILDHQKIEAGKMQVDWEAVDVVELCSDLVDGARLAAERGGVELSLEVVSDVGTVPLDRRKLEKIVQNLLANAVKLTPPGGRVVVKLGASNHRFELSVEDTGPGIPADKRHLLFQRFQQMDTSATRKHEGTGIGLSLVKELTELMGGTVGVESEPGMGARFFVHLPSAVDRLALGPVKPARSTSPPAPRATAPRDGYFAEPDAGVAFAMSSALPPIPMIGARSRVLVAEDNADMRSYLAEILAPEHEVEVVTNGRDALSAARARRPEVIVSDVMMPEMDGSELVSRLKRDPELRDIPIILLTARASRTAAVGGLEGGADDYLGKPFDPAELRARVRAAQRLHRAYLDIAAKNDELEATLRQLAETQEELVQAGKMAAVGTLIAGLSHELNNPIAIILMKTQLLLQLSRAGSLDPALAEKTLGAVEAQANRCAGLVRTLLSHARREPATREPCDVRGALSRVREIAAPEARERKIVLEITDGSQALPAVLASPTQLDSALLNVIGNAIAAVPAGGSVTAVARPRARRGIPGVEIEVRDTGSGIRPEHLQRIFEPFFTTKEPGQGTGLGLSLTRRFFDENRGEIRVESEVGVGTTVVMWLPAMPAETSDGSEAER